MFPSPSPNLSHSPTPPVSCQCTTCCDSDQWVIDCDTKPTVSADSGTVHLNSGLFVVRVPWLGLTHLSDVSEGADVPLFESVQQARVVVLDGPGGGDPDAFDAGVVVGRFNTVRYNYRGKRSAAPSSTRTPRAPRPC